MTEHTECTERIKKQNYGKNNTQIQVSFKCRASDKYQTNGEKTTHTHSLAFPFIMWKINYVVREPHKISYIDRNGACLK